MLTGEQKAGMRAGHEYVLAGPARPVGTGTPTAEE
jgi:hypothetical protein